MAFLIAFLIIVIFFTVIFVKILKTTFLLARYNNRNGAKAGYYSKKVGFFGLKQYVKDAKAWEEEQRKFYQN